MVFQGDGEVVTRVVCCYNPCYNNKAEDPGRPISSTRGISLPRKMIPPVLANGFAWTWRNNPMPGGLQASDSLCVWMQTSISTIRALEKCSLMVMAWQ